jgi:hypothetical protein
MNLSRLLLAADERSEMFRNLGLGFRDKREHFNLLGLVLWLTLIVAAVVVLGLAIRALARRYEMELFNSPNSLFRALCRAHNLTSHQRRLLTHLGRVRAVEPLSRLFLEPEQFELAQLPAELQNQRGDVARLEAILFANSELETQVASGQ